jgi:hypothetical protein
MDTNDFGMTTENFVKQFKEETDEVLRQLPDDEFEYLSSKAEAVGDNDFIRRLRGIESTRRFLKPAPRVSELDDMDDDEMKEGIYTGWLDRQLWIGMQGVPKEVLSPGEKRLLELMQSFFDEFLISLNHRRDDVRVMGWIFENICSTPDDETYLLFR